MCLTNFLLWHLHLAESTPHFLAARRYGSGLIDTLNGRYSKSESNRILRFTLFDVLCNNKNIGLGKTSGIQGSLRVFTGSRGADSPPWRRRSRNLRKLHSVKIGKSITQQTYFADDPFYAWEYLNSATTVLLGWSNNSLFKASRLFLELQWELSREQRLTHLKNIRILDATMFSKIVNGTNSMRCWGTEDVGNLIFSQRSLTFQNFIDIDIRIWFLESLPSTNDAIGRID